MNNKFGIIGLGLIGGSLAKALKARLSSPYIAAFNRSEAPLKAAYDDGVIDAYSNEINDIFKDCGCIFICTPVDMIYEYADKLLPIVSDGCVISDVGSTKKYIADKMKSLPENIYYIGGHPMTGSEKTGYAASKEHLFENAYYIISPADNVPKELVSDFTYIIKTIGALPLLMPPLLHDRAVAGISHIPQIIASALVNTVKEADGSEKYMHTLAAGGFRDITRIASSNPDVWESICFSNPEYILSLLNSFEGVLERFKTSLKEKKENEIHDFFALAKEYRDSFKNINSGSGFYKAYEISVDVIDRPGSIASIALLFSANEINIKNLTIANNREHENGALIIALGSESDRQKSLSVLEEASFEAHIKN
ncbi:MAG: prephenate dehydrogenase/arogenate dehydrogenase family protein [Lachnospiraceae bacterium]|nr:prephenate dehydrogenase/arogenate dehydrogenase family protein [Lachnospiraceae bacterium]